MNQVLEGRIVITGVWIIYILYFVPGIKTVSQSVLAGEQLGII